MPDYIEKIKAVSIAVSVFDIVSIFMEKFYDKFCVA